MTYSQTASLSRNGIYRKNQNTHSLRGSSLSIGPISTIMIVIVLVSFIGMLYLSQVTKTNTYGYKVSTLTQQETTLKREKADLELESVKLQSLERVKNSQAAKELQPIQPTAYAQ